MADAARRHIDDPQQTDAVERVVDQTEVGDHVFDLATLVEARTADQPVGKALRHQLLLNYARLGVGAVHDRDVAGRSPILPQQAFDLLDHLMRLVLLVVADEQRDRLALAVLGPQRLVLAAAVHPNDSLSAVQDRLRGAVVLLQQDDSGAGVVALEVQDVAHVGGPPRVDRLVRIADDADVVVTARR